MAIKRTGGPKPTPPSSDVGGVSRTEGKQAPGKAFAATVDGAAPSSAAAASNADPVRGAVASVAQEVREGAIPAEDAVDRVIEQLVTSELDGASTRVVRAKVTEARAVLGDNPAFLQQLGVLFGAEGVTLPGA